MATPDEPSKTEQAAPSKGLKRRAQDTLHTRVVKKQKVEIVSSTKDGEIVEIQAVASSSTSKTVKVYPLFQPAAVRKEDFRFLKRKGNDSVLHGTHLSPEPRTKVAAFDLDGTLIATKSKSPFPRDARDWKWWNEAVPARLKKLHDEGYAVVILSNQGGLSGNQRKRKEAWETKIGLIAKELSDVPFHVFAATEDDEHRKPRPGMWSLLKTLYAKQGVVPDLEECFYVGDAAGRSGDHSNVDKALAAAIGLDFHTPEEFFLEAHSS